MWSWLGNASFTARSMDHIIWAVFFHSTVVVVVVVTKSARTDNAAAKSPQWLRIPLSLARRLYRAPPPSSPVERPKITLPFASLKVAPVNS